MRDISGLEGVEKHSLAGKRVLPLMIEPKYCTDIDTLEDWEQAEWMLARDNLYIDMPQKTYHNERLVNTTRAINVS